MYRRPTFLKFLTEDHPFFNLIITLYIWLYQEIGDSNIVVMFLLN